MELGLVVTGDIAESNSVGEVLRRMGDVLEMPVYFALGNHDFYRGAIAQTRAGVTRLAAESEPLTYLTAGGVVELSPQTALVGHDGWADARLGDFWGSKVFLNDFVAIRELRLWKDEFTLDKPALCQMLHQLGDEAAQYLMGILPVAAAKYPQVVVATHVPPFREAAWHEGRPSAEDYLPFFACKAVGDVLLEVAEAHSGCQIVVLCGHTHGGGELQVLDNLRVLTGPAEYGKPRVERVLAVA